MISKHKYLRKLASHLTYLDGFDFGHDILVADPDLPQEDGPEQVQGLDAKF